MNQTEVGPSDKHLLNRSESSPVKLSKKAQLQLKIAQKDPQSLLTGRQRQRLEKTLAQVQKEKKKLIDSTD